MSGRDARQRIALGITGASGAPYWKRLVEVLLQEDQEVHVVHSLNADLVCQAELGVDLKEAFAACREASKGKGELKIFEKNDFYSPMASGTAPYLGMAIVPCSMGTLGRVANSMSSDLMTRAADVMLKERRKLILLCRETPVHAIHLENMLRLTNAGAVIVPASPGFYYRPQTIAELVDFMVQRLCDQLGVEVRLVKRWGDQEKTNN